VSQRTKDVLTWIGIVIFVWFCWATTANLKWREVRDEVIKQHEGERITNDTLDKIDKETSEALTDHE
jgi:hypothetical protein